MFEIPFQGPLVSALWHYCEGRFLRANSGLTKSPIARPSPELAITKRTFLGDPDGFSNRLCITYSTSQEVQTDQLELMSFEGVIQRAWWDMASNVPRKTPLTNSERFLGHPVDDLFRECTLHIFRLSSKSVSTDQLRARCKCRIPWTSIYVTRISWHE